MTFLELPKPLRTELLEELKQKISNEFNISKHLITVNIVPQLVFGYRLIVDNTVYDKSLLFLLQSDLNTLNEKINSVCKF